MKWIWILLLSAPMAWSQNGMGYSFAVGLRAGETSGLTLKKSIGSGAAIEGIVGLRHYGGTVTVLYEKYVPAFNAKGLNWYYGAGGHVGFYEHHHIIYYSHPRHGYYRYYDYHNTFTLGIDGIVGLEYKINGAPIAFSLDVKPFVEFGNHGGMFTHLDPGLGIKVAL